MVTAYDVLTTWSGSRVRGDYVQTLNQHGVPVTIFPMTVFNENDQPIGQVENPDEFIQLWNADPTNAAVGRLELGVQNTVFWLIGGVPARGHLLAAEINQGEFNDDFNQDFTV